MLYLTGEKYQDLLRSQLFVGVANFLFQWIYVFLETSSDSFTRATTVQMSCSKFYCTCVNFVRGPDFDFVSIFPFRNFFERNKDKKKKR